jgi:hypothetical protein
VSKLDDANGRQTALLGLIAELREHLSLMVGYYDDMTPQPQWREQPDEHRSGYIAVRALLLRTADIEQACEDALIEQSLLKDERDRLRKIFDDAGEGQYNVLRLVEHYQQEAIEPEAKLTAIRELITEHGCECEAIQSLCLPCQIARLITSKGES